jgi:hypothetical protein
MDCASVTCLDVSGLRLVCFAPAVFHENGESDAALLLSRDRNDCAE